MTEATFRGLGIKPDTMRRVRELKGQLMAERGESVTDDMVIRFLLEARQELADRITAETEAGA